MDRVDGSVLHGGRYVACCEAHKNFADESAYMTADDVLGEGYRVNEAVHRSTENTE